MHTLVGHVSHNKVYSGLPLIPYHIGFTGIALKICETNTQHHSPLGRRSTHTFEMLCTVAYFIGRGFHLLHIIRDICVLQTQAYCYICFKSTHFYR
jgi:hypothetical protein